jgi:hypothetical protein
MKARVEISRGSYGFGHTWTLVLDGKSQSKSFFLGQDVKFCERVLGMSPRYIVQQIGSGEITIDKYNKRLARFIIDTLKDEHGLTGRKLMSMESWELCAQ